MDFRLYGYREAIDCPVCKQKMYLDDVDYDFKGKFDAWWLCEKCNITAFQKVRFGKSYSITFEDEKGDAIKITKGEG